MYKRLFITAIAIAYGALFGGIPAAHALNNDLWIGLCNPCSTTAQFEAAAVNLVYASEKLGGKTPNKTYTVVAIMSNLASSTAFISVQGYFTLSGRAGYVFVPTSSAPVDANGNSLSGQSEAYLEAYYTQVDWTIFGILRSDPWVVTLQGAVATNFINTPDTAISINISIYMDNLHTDPPPGSLIRVEFNDHTVAFYTRTNETLAVNRNKWYVWANVAYYDKSVCMPVPGSATKAICGAPIDHKGNVIINRNTSGTTGGSTNPGPGYYVYPTPLPPGDLLICTYSSYSTMPDGEVIGSTGYGPC